MRGFVAAAVVFVVAACASSTTVMSSWKAPDAGPALMKRTLVVGVTHQEGLRRAFEDVFASELQAAGVEGIPSYSVLATDAIGNQPDMEAAVRRSGATSVLVTRIVNRRKEDTYVPGTATFTPTGPRGPYGYYSGLYPFATMSYSTMYVPPRVVENEVLSVESNVYAAANGELAWSAMSEQFVDVPDATLMRSYARAMVAKMRETGLLR